MLLESMLKRCWACLINLYLTVLSVREKHFYIQQGASMRIVGFLRSGTSNMELLAQPPI